MAAVYLMKILIIIIALGLHGYSQAYISTSLGDPAPRNNGRLTINPLNHIDIVGAIFYIYYGFGWGKPMYTAPIYYKDKKRGTILTYVAPSVINLVVGICFAASYSIFIKTTADYFYIREFLYQFARINITIALFNIIPIYPLDGYKILNLFLSPNTIVRMQEKETFLQITLIAIIIFGIAGAIINPIVDFIMFLL